MLQLNMDIYRFCLAHLEEREVAAGIPTLSSLSSPVHILCILGAENPVESDRVKPNLNWFE